MSAEDDDQRETHTPPSGLLPQCSFSHRTAPACQGTVYLRRAKAWQRGDLLVTRKELRFVPTGHLADIRVAWGDVLGARVLSTLAAGFEPGCFDVTLSPAMALEASGVSAELQSLSGSFSLAKSARFPANASTLRFMTGDLSIAADWVGEIDDAVAAAEEGSLDEWWAGVTARRGEEPLVLDYRGKASPTHTAGWLTRTSSATPSEDFCSAARGSPSGLRPLFAGACADSRGNAARASLPLALELEEELVARFSRTSSGMAGGRRFCLQ